MVFILSVEQLKAKIEKTVASDQAKSAFLNIIGIVKWI
jgi:hypothetical protein